MADRTKFSVQISSYGGAERELEVATFLVNATEMELDQLTEILVRARNREQIKGFHISEASTTPFDELISILRTSYELEILLGPKDWHPRGRGHAR